MQRRFFGAVFLLCVLSFAHGASYTCDFGKGNVVVDTVSKKYNIFLPSTSFSGQKVVGGSYRLFYNDTWYSNTAQEGKLLVDRGITKSRGVDSLGKYESISIVWTWGTEDHWVTSFKCYTNALVFSQSFPSGMQDKPGGLRDLDTPSTVFPAIISTEFSAQNVRLATFFGQNAAMSTRYGTWPEAYAGGYIGGPIALFGGPLGADNALIVSPLTHSMLAVHQVAKRQENEVLEFGLQGLLYTIPSKFSIEFLLYAGTASTETRDGDNFHAGSISQTFMEWGNLLMKRGYGKKTRTAPDKNMWISTIGYSTTGVYHYNPCDCQNNSYGWGCPTSSGSSLLGNCKTYGDNVRLISLDATEKRIPYAWMLIDSWWHAYNNDQPPVNEPYSLYFEDVPQQVGEIFPSTLRTLRQTTKLSFGAHWSSSFSPDSPYRKIGAWECGRDKSGAEVQCVPVAAASDGSTAAFDHIFKSDLQWGMQVLKMDHVLNVLIGGVSSSPNCGHKANTQCLPGERNASIASGSLIQMLTTTDVAERYLNGLGMSAEKNGVDIMLCMSFPNVLMHSVNLNAVSHGRGSTDSHTRHNSHGYPYDNWKGFGGESTLLWSLGMWPFKDTFYSNSSSRVRNEYAEDYGGVETLPFTQALVSALGGGGVAPGGPVGEADRELLMMTCDDSGKLLKPSTPAMYIDRVWSGDNRVGETSVAITSFNEFAWRYVSIINNTDFLLYPKDVGIVSADADKHVAYFWCSSRPLGRSCETRLLPFDKNTPLSVASANWSEPTGSEAQYVLIAPRLPGNWILMGEVDKFIPVSETRMGSFVANSSTIALKLFGRSVGELLHFRVRTPGMQIVHAQCIVKSTSEVLTMTIKSDGRVECSYN